MEHSPKQETKAQEPESPIRARWLWVEAAVWTDSMLMALEKGVKGGKWFSLIDKAYRLPTLCRAWELVAANKGAAGVDRITIERFRSQALTYLSELSEALQNGSYKPQAVRRVYIPKGGGKIRPLGIPTVKDRIVQCALKIVLEPIFEAEFLEVSYGFRPGRSAKDALRQVDQTLHRGYTWVVDADIASYFDSIPHDKLLEKVKRRISDSNVLSLVDAFLHQQIMEEMKAWVPSCGTPQGGVLSPLLANIYLHDLDVSISQAGFTMVRYADDFVILTPDEESAHQALKLVCQWVESNGLTLHPDKTHVGDCRIRGQGFDFLGYRFEAGCKMVRKKSLMKFKDRLRELTSRTCGQSIHKVVHDLNRVLRGWFNYFKHANKWTFDPLDGFIRRRLRAILRRQEKRPGQGRTLDDHIRWPNAFFAKLGLFTMQSAHRLAVAVAHQSR